MLVAHFARAAIGCNIHRFVKEIDWVTFYTTLPSGDQIVGDNPNQLTKRKRTFFRSGLEASKLLCEAEPCNGGAFAGPLLWTVAGALSVSMFVWQGFFAAEPFECLDDTLALAFPFPFDDVRRAFKGLIFEGNMSAI